MARNSVWTYLCCFFLHLAGVREIGSLIFSLFRLCRSSYRLQRAVISVDRLGPEILTMLEIKGQVLQRVRLNLKVPGWLSDLNDRKLPMFLWRLN